MCSFARWQRRLLCSVRPNYEHTPKVLFTDTPCNASSARAFANFLQLKTPHFKQLLAKRCKTCSHKFYLRPTTVSAKVSDAWYIARNVRTFVQSIFHATRIRKIIAFYLLSPRVNNNCKRALRLCCAAHGGTFSYNIARTVFDIFQLNAITASINM